MKCIAKTLEGLENILADEIEQLGGHSIEIITRAVVFECDQKLLYKCNLLLRSCLKILVYIEEFTIKDEKELYSKVYDFPWENYFSLSQTFAIDSVVNSEFFRHANYISLKAKDAIVDRFRNKFNDRPNINVANPDFKINIHIRQKTVTISLDSTGESLHIRGFGKRLVEAPLNEVLAAGIVLISGWKGENTLLDPMCGSGTLVSEAAKIALGRPPVSQSRKFLFENWNDFNNSLLTELKVSLFSQSNESNPSILASDYDSKAVQATIFNVGNANLTEFINITECDFFFHEGIQNSTIIINPPYNERLKIEEINQMYAHIGDKLKHSFNGCTAWIVSSNMEAIKHVGLRPSRKIKLMNGNLPVILCKFDLYAGSKKQKFQNEM